MVDFEFAAPPRILFRRGAVREVAVHSAIHGHRALLVTGRTGNRSEPLTESLKRHGVTTVPFHVPGEPTTRLVSEGVGLARETGCERVIGMGGGSVLDTAKAVSALLTNPGDLMDYLEVIGRGQPLTRAAAPCIAIPTTAGTGAEVTRNAVIASEEHRVKVSLRSPYMIPAVAVVDPELTCSMPPALTAATGLDALTQVIEPFVCARPNPLTDGICREALQRASSALRRAFQDGSDVAAREDMCLVSLFGGLALANAKLGAVHGFAGPIGGMFPAPHGAVCGRLLPCVIDANIHALRQRGSRETLARYDEIAQRLTGRPDTTAEDGVAWVRNLCDTMAVPGLSQYGVTPKDFLNLVTAARKASSMKGNPVELTEDELAAILEKAL